MWTEENFMEQHRLNRISHVESIIQYLPGEQFSNEMPDHKYDFYHVLIHWWYFNLKEFIDVYKSENIFRLELLNRWKKRFQ